MNDNFAPARPQYCLSSSLGSEVWQKEKRIKKNAAVRDHKVDLGVSRAPPAARQMQLCEDEGWCRRQQKFYLMLWGAEEQFDWIGATVKTTRFICVVRASRISPYYFRRWREKMLFDCVFLSIIRRLQVAHDHRSIFRDDGPIKTAVGWRIWGRSMFTALRIPNNNHVPAAQHWFQQLGRRLRLLLELQPTDIIKVLQTARFSILQIIFVLGENFNFFISPEDSGVAASALWFI